MCGEPAPNCQSFSFSNSSLGHSCMDRKFSAHIDNGLAPPSLRQLEWSPCLSLLQLRHPQFQGLINTDSLRQPLSHSIIPSGARDYYLPVTLAPHPTGTSFLFRLPPLNRHFYMHLCHPPLWSLCIAPSQKYASPLPCDVLDGGLTRRHACWHTCTLT